MSTFGIASRILVTLGATGSLLAASAGCGSSGASASSGGTGTGGAGTTSTTSAGTGGATGSSSGGTGGAAADAGADASDAMADGPPCIRRPFLIDGVPRAGGLVERSDWLDAREAFAAPLDAAMASALAAAWAADGAQEHASIAAFARFTMLLVAVGAPPDLVVGAQRAGLDEVAHARGCFGLSRRCSGRDAGPGPVSLRGALAAEAALADVAALTVHEGCVGETLGVLLATEQLGGAADPETRAVLERIVRDEQRHAELAWSFVRWALSRGGAPVRAAVEAAFAEAVRETLALAFAPVPVVDAAAWRAYGRLTADEARALVQRGLAEIVEPCRGALLQAPSTESPAPATRVQESV